MTLIKDLDFWITVSLSFSTPELQTWFVWGTNHWIRVIISMICLFLSLYVYYNSQSSLQTAKPLSSVQFSGSVISDSLRHPCNAAHWHPCPSPTPRDCSNSCPSSQWCHPVISSSVIRFSSCLKSFPASGSFHMSQFFASGGQSIGASASASVLPMNIQDWFPLGLTGLILQSKGFSRVFSNSTI